MTDRGPRWGARAARTAWLIYAIGATLGALAVLAIYVNTYDDYDISERLRAVGAFTRRAMSALTFPLGAAVSALAGPPLEAMFGCDEATRPCAVFVDWNARFAALVIQIVTLRWLIARRLS